VQNLRRERQLEGIVKAKAEGAYKGGKRRLDRETVLAMFGAGQGPAAIAKALGCSGMQVYRVLGEGTPEKLNGLVASVEVASWPKVVRERMNKPVVAEPAGLALHGVR
jgi:hypothetical protein